MQAIRDFRYLTHNRNKLSREQIQALQFKELQLLMTFVKEKSPYYHHDDRYQPLRTWDDFYHLPTLNKSMMMEHFTTLNTCGLDRDETMAYALEKERNKDYLGYYKDEYVIGLSSGTSEIKAYLSHPNP